MKEKRGEIINNFINHIKNNNKKLLVTKSSIFDVMKVCFAAQKSVKLNKSITINYK